VRARDDAAARERVAAAARAERDQARDAAREELGREELGRAEAEAARLRGELEARPTAAEAEALRRELAVLQRVEYNVLDGDGRRRGRRRGRVGRRRARQRRWAAAARRAAAARATSAARSARPRPRRAAARLRTSRDAARRVEQLLVARVRQLETDALATLRGADDARAEARRAKDALATTERKLAEREALVARLDEDLVAGGLADCERPAAATRRWSRS
jgi:hypothetical protein